MGKKKASKKAAAKPASNKPLLDEAEALNATGKAKEALAKLIAHIRKM